MGQRLPERQLSGGVLAALTDRSSPGDPLRTLAGGGLVEIDLSSSKPWPAIGPINQTDVALEDGPEVVARVVDGLFSKTTGCA